MKAPLVSILVPSYNHRQFLKERIDSIVNQTYKQFELIVIDDRSNDGSDKVLKNLSVIHDFQYIRNEHNSGSPFSAWDKISKLAKGKYIWICESDDVAEQNFLEIAVNRLEANPAAAIFYSNSWVIDENSDISGHTENYFHDVWKETRWNKDFSAKGNEELENYQVRGQTVPNMSSALIRSDTFCKAFDPNLKKLKLTGDWLFIGEALRLGDVEFCSQPLSRFREHEVTSRVRVQSARSQAEFILTKYRLFKHSGKPTAEFATIMASDVIRFLYEPALLWNVMKEAISISAMDSFWCALKLLTQALKKPIYFRQFRERQKHSKQLAKEEI